MKTISMSLEEYEDEQNRAKSMIDNRSYNQGAMDALRLVKILMTENISSISYHGFTDPNLEKLLIQTVKDIIHLSK